MQYLSHTSYVTPCCKCWGGSRTEVSHELFLSDPLQLKKKVPHNTGVMGNLYMRSNLSCQHPWLLWYSGGYKATSTVGIAEDREQPTQCSSSDPGLQFLFQKKEKLTLETEQSQIPGHQVEFPFMQALPIP